MRAAPANPAQVMDAMVEAVCIEFLRRSPFNVDWSIQTEGYKNVRRGHMRAALTAAIGAGGQAVQDTWFTDRALPVKAMSGDVEDNRVLRLHFRRPVTDDDRKAMCDALNLHQASLSQPHPADERVVEALREISGDIDGTWEEKFKTVQSIARSALSAKEGR